MSTDRDDDTLLLELAALNEKVLALEEKVATHLERDLQVGNQALATDLVAARLAHEVNNPLMAMKAHLQILRGHLGSGSPVATNSLDVVSAQLNRIAATVRALVSLVPPSRDPS